MALKLAEEWFRKEDAKLTQQAFKLREDIVKRLHVAEMTKQRLLRTLRIFPQQQQQQPPQEETRDEEAADSPESSSSVAKAVSALYFPALADWREFRNAEGQLVALLPMRAGRCVISNSILEKSQPVAETASLSGGSRCVICDSADKPAWQHVLTCHCDKQTPDFVQTVLAQTSVSACARPLQVESLDWIIKRCMEAMTRLTLMR